MAASSTYSRGDVAVRLAAGLRVADWFRHVCLPPTTIARRQGRSWAHATIPCVGPEVPSGVRRLLEALRDAGGRPYLVGGAVRDALLGLPSQGSRHRGLRPSPPASQGGARPGRPRGRGRRGLHGLQGQRPRGGGRARWTSRSRGATPRPALATAASRSSGDPDLSLEEAARRRDFTINAMMFDPFAGALARSLRRPARPRSARPARGRPGDARRRSAARAARGAARGALRADGGRGDGAPLRVDAPGRAARGARLRRDREAAAQGAAPLDRAARSSREWGMLPAVAPELVPLDRHAPGSRVAPRRRRLDPHAAGGGPGRAAARRPRRAARARGDAGRRCVTISASRRRRACWTGGCARTATRRRDCRPQARCSTAGTSIACTATTSGPRCSASSAITSSPASSTTTASASRDGAIRRLARKCEPALLYRVARADCLGRTGDFPPVAMEWFLERVRAARRGGARRPTRSSRAATCWSWA